MVRNISGIAGNLFGIGAVTLCFASYMGNKVISIGHLLLLSALVIFAVSFTRDLPKNELFIDLLRRKLKCRYRLSAVCLWLLVLVYIVSIVWNWNSYENPFLDIKKIRYLLIPLLLLIALDTIPMARRKRWFKWCLTAWWASMVLATTYGLIVGFRLALQTPVTSLAEQQSAFAGFVRFDQIRVAGIFGNVMSFAYSLQFSFLLLVVFLLNWKRPEIKWVRSISGIKWAIGIGGVVAGLGLYFSFTRGAVLGVVVGLFSIVFVRRSWRLLGLVLIVGLLGGGYSFMNDDGFFRSVKNEDMRVIQWRTAGLTFLAYPEFGVGYRNFEKRCGNLKTEFGMPKDFGEDGSPPIFGQLPSQWYNGHAHNNYMEAFASTGFLGGLLFVGFVGFWFAEVVRSKIAKHYFVPIILAFFVSGFFENTFTDSEVINVIMLIYLASQLVLDWEQSDYDSGLTRTVT